jgi:hypothetical protein
MKMKILSNAVIVTILVGGVMVAVFPSVLLYVLDFMGSPMRLYKATEGFFQSNFYLIIVMIGMVGIFLIMLTDNATVIETTATQHDLENFQINLKSRLEKMGYRLESTDGDSSLWTYDGGTLGKFLYGSDLTIYHMVGGSTKMKGSKAVIEEIKHVLLSTG